MPSRLPSRHLLNKPRIRNIQDVAGDPDHKLLLLGEGVALGGEALALGLGCQQEPRSLSALDGRNVGCADPAVCWAATAQLPVGTR